MDTTYFTHHEDIKTLFTSSKKTSADQAFTQLAANLFTQSDHNFSEQLHGQIAVIRDCLKKQNLTPYIQNMQQAMLATLNKEDEYQPETIEQGLYDFVGKLIYVSASDALFASSLFTPQTYTDYRNFDNNSYFLSAGIPAFVFKGLPRGT